MCDMALTKHLAPLEQSNEQGEPTASYKWTSCDGETIGLRLKTARNLHIILEEFREYIIHK